MLLQGREVPADSADLGAAGRAGQEEQDRRRRVVAADHHAEPVAVHVDAGQLGDAGRQGFAVRAQDRGGPSGNGHRHRRK